MKSVIHADWTKVQRLTMNCITHPPLARIDGQDINLATLDAAVDAAIGRAREHRGFRLFTLNLDHLVKRRDDTAFRRAYELADFVSADGAPVAVLARRQGAPLERTTGADLVEPLCAAAAREGIPIAFFGATTDTLEISAKNLCARYPGLKIVYCEAPPFGFNPTSAAAEEAGRRIAESGARMVFVALGAPKQELFAAHMADKTPALGFICIGAALDFIAGTQSRAPLVFQKTGLEWLWRLATNPGRMARRYALCALMLHKLLRENSRGRSGVAQA
ncbi:MAG: WecB/TagA/CpsF family glycosyltransferase [Beijerinckiaceae bacterium]|jgi:exopolysaccharide biosynthesis WecB/TagA/CpsF family protein|nr:WecB/TagA/CpsF family glycosyltransferase [Beijerinckiaceae bacterium]